MRRFRSVSECVGWRKSKLEVRECRNKHINWIEWVLGVAVCINVMHINADFAPENHKNRGFSLTLIRAVPLNTKRMFEIQIFSSMNDHIFIQHQKYLLWKYLNYMYSLDQENIFISDIRFVFKPAKSRELIKIFILAVETWKLIEQIKSYSNFKILKGVLLF